MCKSELPERDIISKELAACTDIAAEADEDILTDEPSEKRARGRGSLFSLPIRAEKIFLAVIVLLLLARVLWVMIPLTVHFATLILLARAQRRISRSLIAFSNDEGKAGTDLKNCRTSSRETDIRRNMTP